MMVTSLDVVNVAKTWLGTPYHHQGRLKNVGVDCIGLVIGVAHELGISDFEIKTYGRIPNGKMMLSLMRQEMIEIPKTEKQSGDIGLFVFNRDPQHVAIFTDDGMIHSYAQVNKCIEHGFTPPWTERLVAVFRYKGIE